MSLLRLLTLFAVTACSNASDGTPDAAPLPVDGTIADTAAPALHILVINEVAAGEAPDWFEIVNVSNADVQLADFIYHDGSIAAPKPFASGTLAPGAYLAQDVSDEVSGFKLGSDEELHVLRATDMAVSDEVDWAEGAAAAGTSYRRIPDTTGEFATGAQTRGAPN